MSTFPGSPRVQKGAIIGVDPLNPLASVIVFQYNPDTLTRTLTAQTTGADNADRGEGLRLKGPLRELIKLDVEIDDADQLEQGKAPATSLSLNPTLASLEMLHEAIHNPAACDDINKGASYPPSSPGDNAYSEYFALDVAAGYKTTELKKPATDGPGAVKGWHP